MEQSNISISEKQGKLVDGYPKSTMPVLVSTSLLILATVALGGVMWWYNADLNTKIETLNQDIAVVEKEITKLDTQSNLIAESKRLAMAAKTYTNFEKMDLDWMRFLDRVKTNTIAEVTYSAFSIDRKKGTFRIDGVAPSYRVVAEQLSIYMNDNEYEQANLVSAVLRPENEDKSKVSFSIELTPTKEAFMAEQITEGLDLVTAEQPEMIGFESDVTK